MRTLLPAYWDTSALSAFKMLSETKTTLGYIVNLRPGLQSKTLPQNSSNNNNNSTLKKKGFLIQIRNLDSFKCIFIKYGNTQNTSRSENNDCCHK